MEKKSGVIATREGLFIPARYFRQMSDTLEVVISPREISIRSSAKPQAKMRARTATQRSPKKAD
jgi:hypothetical protein